MSISELAGDTIGDILSRIPVRSIVQFKCVCKSWCSLISTTHFVKLHLNRAVNDVNTRCNRFLLSIFPCPSLSCNGVADSSGLINHVSRFVGSDISFVGSCNGLVCAVLGYHKIHVVFNPTTRALITLPKPIISSEEYFRYGFGYDSSMDDYKLLRIFSKNNWYVPGEPVLAEIFSMRNNCWRKIDDIPAPIAFSNGAGYDIAGSTGGREIVTFDLRSERFELVSRHNNAGVNVDDVSAGVLQDCLLVTSYHPDRVVEVMLENPRVVFSWTKVCNFPYHEENMPLYGSWMEPVRLEDGELLMVDGQRQLVMYNPTESTFRDIGIRSLFEHVVYFETLVSPRIGA